MDYENIIKEQFNNVITQEEIDQIVNNSQTLTEGFINDFMPQNILNSMLRGESIFNTDNLINNLLDLFLLEMKSALILCVEIISICIVMGILNGLSSSFSSKSISEISLLICSMVIIGMAIESLKVTYNLSQDTVEAMSNTMTVIMPILIGILISTGSITSGTILSPLIIGSITGISFIIKTFILPALFISTILSLINCLTEKNYVNKLAKLIRNLAVGLTGLLLVLLTGIITIQGLLTETSDGLLINTAKFSLSNFIPIIGGFTSDTVELFLRCMTSIKSIIGIFGIILMVLFLIIPILKILSIAIIYKFTAAIAEPVTSSKIADGLNDMGSCIVSIASIILFTSMLFIMFISVIINIGGS